MIIKHHQFQLLLVALALFNSASLATAVNCPFGLYGKLGDTCICLDQGLWAVREDYCRIPLSIHAVPKGVTFCIPNQGGSVQQISKLLTFEQPEVVQLSESMNKDVDRFDPIATTVPTPEDVYPNRSVLITFGASSWTLTTPEQKSFCLKNLASPMENYCLFHLGEDLGEIRRVQTIHIGCDDALPLINPSNCTRITSASRNCEEALTEKKSKDEEEDILSWNSLRKLYKFFTNEDVEDLINQNNNNNSISKRAGTVKLKSPEKKNDEDDEIGLLSEDEDDVKLSEFEVGHELMRDQIDNYVDTIIAQLVGLYDEVEPMNREFLITRQKEKKRYPVINLLETIKLIMQKTCTPVKPEYFDLALNSFLKVQLEGFHIKEPYVSHTAYTRIHYALKQCYDQAKAHAFVYENNTATKSCPKKRGTSTILDLGGNGKKLVHLDEIPEHARATLRDSGTVLEPLIETVWKMVVNAHSYCYPYFKAYFNDHHTLSVTLLPLFNNAIQDIWLKSGGYVVDNRQRIYGGVLGNVIQILEDVDNCVFASRRISQYPWYMSRPMRDSKNVWKRKRRKRELPADSKVLSPTPVYVNDGNTLCLYDPDDPVAFLGKPVCI